MTVQFLFKILFVVVVSIFFARCQADQTREAARQSALQAPTEPATAPPTEPVRQPSRPATSGELGLSATGGTAAQGGEVCVPVKTLGFRQIMSMQYSMKWDAKVLKYKSVRNFGLPGLGTSNFGAHRVGEGLLTYSWLDNEVKGITRDDGQTLYEICFEAIGGAGSKSKFEFADAPTIIEISNAASQFLDLAGQPALVEVR